MSHSTRKAGRNRDWRYAVIDIILWHNIVMLINRTPVYAPFTLVMHLLETPIMPYAPYSHHKSSSLVSVSASVVSLYHRGYKYYHLCQKFWRSYPSCWTSISRQSPEAVVNIVCFYDFVLTRVERDGHAPGKFFRHSSLLGSM